jgi:TetR/AcrR family transcriptional regulator, lmrAB and yxaGH operons repressor
VPSDARDRMIAGAARLLARHGLQATSFSTVLAETGAPRGSIYHHFPGGKDEMVIAAIGATERHVIELLDFPPGTSVRQVVESFLGAWRLLLTAGDFHAGCALVAVTVAAETDDVRERAAHAFGAWRTALAAALQNAGLEAAVAESTAALLLSASEGAVVMSRAERDLGPFDTVAASLLAYIDQLVRRRRAGPRP